MYNIYGKDTFISMIIFISFSMNIISKYLIDEYKNR